jgi:hypothetical protein
MEVKLTVFWWGRCLAWYDASLGRWSSPVRIRPTPYFEALGLETKIDEVASIQ